MYEDFDVNGDALVFKLTTENRTVRLSIHHLVSLPLPLPTQAMSLCKTFRLAHILDTIILGVKTPIWGKRQKRKETENKGHFTCQGLLMKIAL